MKQFDLVEDPTERASFIHLLTVEGAKMPTFHELSKVARRDGDNGVLDSALHLPTSEYVRLEEICNAHVPTYGKTRRRKS